MIQNFLVILLGPVGESPASIETRAAPGRAIREREDHGWMRDRADPHARERALSIAWQDPPPGASPDEAVAAVRDALDTIGTPVRSARRRDDALSEKSPRRPHAARKSRLDRARVPPAVERFTGKERRSTINS